MSHWISQVVAASARYSALDEVRETVDCFLDFHEMREFPRKIE